MVVADQLRDALKAFGRDPEQPLMKADFQAFLQQDTAKQILRENNVDVLALVEGSEIIFEDLEHDTETGGGMGFAGLIDLILNTRGTNHATVRDVKEQLRVIKTLLAKTTTETLKNINDGLYELRVELHERDADRDEMMMALADDDSDLEGIDFADVDFDDEVASTSFTPPPEIKVG